MLDYHKRKRYYVSYFYEEAGLIRKLLSQIHLVGTIVLLLVIAYLIH